MVKTTREMSKGVPPYIWKNISVEPVLYSRGKLCVLQLGGNFPESSTSCKLKERKSCTNSSVLSYDRFG